MAEWVAGFDYPEGGFIELDMSAEDVAERAAQQIADRGGELDQAYAEEAYVELKAIRDRALERNASPVIVFAPAYPSELRPMLPITAFVAPWDAPPEQRTPEAIAELARQPQPYRFQEPDVKVVELPAGPACRVHELVLNDVPGDERQLVMEYVSYYVIPKSYPGGVVELTVSWSSPTFGNTMLETADEMAESLTLRPAESAEFAAHETV
ncbi:hypothetical protein [Streptomyces hoynatensis]|uniref:Uncharacterized protein n=1 Tax=Streptomyces hoynatensis TaxID=1141874 RepID=A0A3A9Z3Y2_9ACTN|nr:hypothetical protein [Streptomyces hoynatensis]RKN42950.1 hypothetical protein D7294_10500 [Streptomyces hoynatensis]